MSNSFNTKYKVYPDGNYKATYSNKSIFKDPSKPSTDYSVVSSDGEFHFMDDSIEQEPSPTYYIDVEEIAQKKEQERLERVKAQEKEVNPEWEELEQRRKQNNIERAISRAKQKIFDIVYLNDFKYFVTVNFDTKKVNSRNATEVMSKLIQWLKHQTQRNSMQYILIPEYHTKSHDGATDRIHCHLLISDYPSHLLVHAIAHEKGGKVKHNKNGSPRLLYNQNGQPIYNMLGWKYGYSTCIPIFKAGDSNIKLAHYITKYITKDVRQIFGKYYWSSKGLKREVDTYYFDSDFESLPFKEYKVPHTRIRLKYESQFSYMLGTQENKE